MVPRRLFVALRLVLLFTFGLVVGLHYARMGYMPLDQSICFDGGWRLLCGQVPFVDFTAPNGFPVHAIQALFFALFGVNWLAYCLHAATFNGLFVLLVDRLLVSIGLGWPASSAFALCSAFVFYPPFGVPYMDQHAFFFSLAALVAAIAAARSEWERARRWSAFSIGPLFALAYLSKQIPSVLFLPAVCAVAVWAKDRAGMLWRLAFGALVTALVLFLAAVLLGIDWHLVQTYWRRLPAEEGMRRLAYVPSPLGVLRRFEETRRQIGLHTITIVHVVGLGGVLLVPLFWRKSTELRQAWACFLLAEFLLVACLLFIALTGNQKEIGVPLVFASAGCVAAGLGAWRRSLEARGAASLARLPLLGAAAMLGVALADAWKFDRAVDATRKVNDIQFHASAGERASDELPEALGYLRWNVPEHVQYSPKDLRELVDYLRSREGSFWLLGDASVLYGICAKPSISPSLWFHPGLTFPLPQDPEFAKYEDMLRMRIQREDIRAIVIEPRVWVGYRGPDGDRRSARLVTLDTFPRVKQVIDARKVGERSFGPFRVIELGP